MDLDKYAEHIFTYCIVIALATFSGVVKVVRNLQNMKERLTLREILLKAIGDILISIFAGLLMYFYLSVSDAGVLDYQDALLISIASYMGAQAIDVFVALWKSIHDKTSGGKS